jgi:hypothetical protein
MGECQKNNKNIQRITKPAEIAARITNNINNSHDHRHFINIPSIAIIRQLILSYPLTGESR